MTDPREEFSPFWPQSIAPIGATPRPPGSPPREFPRINPALLALWDWSKIPIPPAQRPWFPPATPRATTTASAADSANGRGATPEPLDAPGQPRSESRGILYSFSQPQQSWPGAEPLGGSGGILGSLPLPSNPWLGQPTYDAGGPTQDPSTPSRNTIDRGDLAKSLGIGLVQGAISVPGMFGDARELFAQGAQRLADYVAPGYGPTVGTAVSRGLRLLPNMGGPGSSDIRGLIEPLTGPFYQPKTLAGDYARTVGELAPGMLAPGGVARNAVRYAVLPALASETAGQATQGTWAEPWARAIAALATGGAGAALDHLPRGVRARPLVEQSPHSGTTGEMPAATAHRSNLPHSAPSDAPPVRSVEPEITSAYLEPGSVRTAPGGQGKLFDDSRLHEVPPVEQFDLPRYQPLRGVPGYIQALDNPRTFKELDRLAEIGSHAAAIKLPTLSRFANTFSLSLDARKAKQHSSSSRN